MFFVYALVKTLDGRESIVSVSTSQPAAERDLRMHARAAEDPESDHAGATFEVQKHFNSVDVLDLWEMIRSHPAYAFGTLFVQGDLDRGVPQAFSPEEGERIVVDAGQDYIDGLYVGEPGRHRLRSRLRRGR